MNNKNIGSKASCYCRCCGRDLSDPKSISRGIGPICWKKLNNPYQELIEKLMDKGERENNDYPDLAFYQQYTKRNCPNCNNILDPLEHFKHEGGMVIRSFKERQWIFAHCNKCKIDYAFWKIRKDGVVRCLTCNKVMAPGDNFYMLNKKEFPGNSKIYLCNCCYHELEQKPIKKRQINSLITSFF